MLYKNKYFLYKYQADYSFSLNYLAQSNRLPFFKEAIKNER